MPYKNPERKRQWERENREHRNALRRKRYAVQNGSPLIQRPAPDPADSHHEPLSPWKCILAYVVGVLILFGVGVGAGRYGDKPGYNANTIGPDNP